MAGYSSMGLQACDRHQEGGTGRSPSFNEEATRHEKVPCCRHPWFRCLRSPDWPGSGPGLEEVLQGGLHAVLQAVQRLQSLLHGNAVLRRLLPAEYVVLSAAVWRWGLLRADVLRGRSPQYGDAAGARLVPGRPRPRSPGTEH